MELGNVSATTENSGTHGPRPCLPPPPRPASRCGWFALIFGSVVTAAATPVAPPTLLSVSPVGAGKAGFTQLAPQTTGVWFTNVLPEPRYLTNQILPNGSGVAAGDVDGDGWCDLYFCGLNSDNQLYRNLGGWKFENITERAGVAAAGLDATGAAFADLDGDGDLDLVVNSIGGGTHLFFNDGHGRFQPGSLALNPQRAGTSLALADLDGDGDLDLYIANYRVSSFTDMPGTRFSFKVIDGQPTVSLINGRPLTDPEWTNRFVFHVSLGPGGRGKFSHEELGEPDALYLNDGRGGFVPVSFTGGMFLDESGHSISRPLFDWGLSAVLRDFSGDGLPDLYVCNDFSTPDRFWIHDGQNHLRAAPAVTLRHTSLASMAIDAADLNGDGLDDFIVLDMLSREHERRLTQRNIMRAELAPAELIDARPQYPRNTLFLSRGDGTYAEIAQYAGVDASEWSWNPIFLDVDLDGYADLLVPNGFVRDNMNLDGRNQINQARAGRGLTPAEELQLRRYYPILNTPNLAFHNLGNLRFAECSAPWGFAEPVISQGACLADLDNDGDLDVVLNNLNQVASLYRNDSSAPRLAVRLRGRPPNTGGVGARITVSGGPAPQTQEMLCGGRYCSGDQGQRTFATGRAESVEVEVRWRSGRVSTITNIPPNQLLVVNEPDGPSPEATAVPGVRTSPETRPTSLISFEDVSDVLGHAHVDLAFDDLDRQPLLPRRLSQLGPGVAWWDLDCDGRDDLVVGTGRGGHPDWYRNLGNGRFDRSTNSAWRVTAERDLAGWAGLEPGVVLGAVANYEDNATNGPGVLRWCPNGPTPVLPLAVSSFGPLAVADYDGDGALDLFVGVRVTGGRYPEPGQSAIYRQAAGTFQVDLTNTATLPPGLVSSAIWTDLNADGWPELVLACDWGPLVVLINHQGKLEPWNPPLQWPEGSKTGNQPSSLGALTGWWNGIAAGDFDGDGRLDLVGANWGGNTRYERWRPAPVRIYYVDLEQNGGSRMDILETHYVPELRAYAPDRLLDAVSRSLPQLAERFPTHLAWARADIDHILGDARPRARMVEANWLESTLFLNRGNHFEVHPLPAEAQFAPAFAVAVGDPDGDGADDLFLSQNFFDVDMDTSRLDAGRGLWLRGDGRGRFSAVPGQDCGVKIYGEQRGAALADYDADGRVDLVVAQNNAETKLYHNIRGRPGLRVRLEGPPKNPCGIGAAVRLKFGERLGPAREARAGGGYWSQDSPVLVMGMPSAPTAVQVRWPGGRVTETAVPAGAREMVCRF